MIESQADVRAKTFEMFRSMFTQAGREPTIEDFRRAYDWMFTNFAGDPDATVTEVDVDGVRSLRVEVPAVPKRCDVVYFHGGGYMVGNPEGVVSTAAKVARAAKASVLVPDYRLAPEHPHPAARDDGVTAIRWLLANGGSASRLALIGDSAGGGLALSTVLTLRDLGELPAAVALWSPWVDMEAKGDILDGVAERDPIASREWLLMSAQAYLQGQDPQTPTANLLYADLSGFPPLFIESGEVEVLLDDSFRLAQRAAHAGVDVSLHVTPGVPHVYQYFAGFLPEAQHSIDMTGRFIAEHVS
jgi:monoterpene epsilon-lactone hydrolase